MIAARTRVALEAAKARGKVLGNTVNLEEAREKAVARIEANADRYAANVLPVIREIQKAVLAH